MKTAASIEQGKSGEATNAAEAERRRMHEEEFHAALAKLGQSLNSATTAQEAARIIGTVVDDLFGWDACAVNMYVDGKVYPILNMDIVDGKRCNLEAHEIPSMPSLRTQRVMEHGAEIFLVDHPTALAPDANPF